MSVEQSRMFYSRLEHSRTVHQLVTADHLRPPQDHLTSLPLLSPPLVPQSWGCILEELSTFR